MSFSPDSKILAAATSKTGILLIDPSNKSILKTLTPHEGFTYSVVFSNDAKYLASGGSDKVAIVFDATRDYKIKYKLETFSEIRNVNFSKNS